jgi:4,5-dihydroxyphthalate decarboxylase
MTNLVVSMASRPYDGIMPLVRGEVAIPGAELQIRLDTNVPRVFGALYKGEVDVSEMSLAELIYYTSRDEAEFVGIPIFPSRVFRHEHIFYNVDSGIRTPADLGGKRIGLQRWVQTAAVWIRGTLVEHYGVDPAKTSWYVATTHHWDDPAHEDDIQPRDGSVIRRYQTPSVTSSELAYRALIEGEVDAMGVTEVQAPMLRADGRVRRLFENYRGEETTYFQKTRIFPIMHVLAMRRSLADAHPELPTALFHAFCESKRKAHQLFRDIPSWSLAWKDRDLEEERDVFGGDLWPFGVAANRHVVDTFIGYCYQQGIAARQLKADDLFHPSTRELSED